MIGANRVITIKVLQSINKLFSGEIECVVTQSEECSDRRFTKFRVTKAILRYRKSYRSVRLSQHVHMVEFLPFN